MRSNLYFHGEFTSPSAMIKVLRFAKKLSVPALRACVRGLCLFAGRGTFAGAAWAGGG